MLTSAKETSKRVEGSDKEAAGAASKVGVQVDRDVDADVSMVVQVWCSALSVASHVSPARTPSPCHTHIPGTHKPTLFAMLLPRCGMSLPT